MKKSFLFLIPLRLPLTHHGWPLPTHGRSLTHQWQYQDPQRPRWPPSVKKKKRKNKHLYFFLHPSWLLKVSDPFGTFCMTLYLPQWICNGAKMYCQLRYNFGRENVNVGALFTLPILFFHLAVFHRKKNPPPPSPYQKSLFFQKLSKKPFYLDFSWVY